jgi:cytochrome c oxidase subunit 2
MKSSTVYLITAFIIAFAVLLMVPLWSALGATGGEAHGHAMTNIEQPDYFTWRLEEQTKKYGQPDGSIRLTSSGGVYILTMQYAFIPRVIRLETGRKYNLHFYSPDVIHGVSLIHVDQHGLLQPFSLNNVIPPGPMTMITIEPRLPGEILIVCTEYCGLGHHIMQAKIIVEGEPYPVEVVPWYQRIGILDIPLPTWLHHDLYIDQVAAIDPELIWTPPTPMAAFGFFMAPHGEWGYWHYHGLSEKEEELLRAADMTDGKLDGKITPGTPGIPRQFIEHFNLPPEKTRLYMDRPTQ